MSASDVAFRGNAWYDALPEIIAVSVRITHNGIDHHYEDETTLSKALTTGRVQSIALDLTLVEPGTHQPISVHRVIEIDAIACRNEGWSMEEAVILVAGNAGIGRDRLARLIHASLFFACDDSDCDSWETQASAFDRESRAMATRILLGEDAAILEEIRMAAADSLSWLLPADRAVRIDLRRNALTIAFLPQGLAV